MNEQTEIARPHPPWDEAPESPYYIALEGSFQERRPRTLKHGDTFGVFDHYGDILTNESSPEGLYHEDTRFLSHLLLQLDGRRPLLLSSILREDNSSLSVDLTNPDFLVGGTVVLPRDTVHINRTKFIFEAASYERISVRSYHHHADPLTLRIGFAADFVDLFEVRGQKRQARGTLSGGRISETAVLLRYIGLDDIVRETLIRFWPPPVALTRDLATFKLDYAPYRWQTIYMQAACTPTDSVWHGSHFVSTMQKARRALRRSRARAADIDSSNSIFNEVFRRCVSDLGMLITDTPEGPYPYAGIPWFSTVFGRDALITAWLSLWLDPEIARGVLCFLAAHQATGVDPARDAEPGKILHEMRRGEMARLGEIPFGLYYGSVDSTPLFVALAGAYLKRTGDLSTIEKLWPNIRAALAWIDQYGDSDGDGFVEYGRVSANGLVNQGWKDSVDSVFHADGTLAQGPIALCEVQAYVYLAKRYARRMAQALGRPQEAAAYERQAEKLRQQLEDRFWCEEESCYALALDGAKQPCRVVSSNAGHVLFAGAAAPERAARLAKVLLGPTCFSGWGIRTIAQTEARYNPMSYHNGSIWPHDNAIIALGLAHYGFKSHVTRIFHALFDAATHMDLRRLPELFCGFSRKQSSAPTSYPVACTPQAWASATTLALLQASLGLSFDYRTRELRFQQPMLPEFLDELTLHNLRLDDATADVQFRRHDDNSIAVTVLRRHGDLRVVVVQ